jgi:hypothetical protein
VYSKPEPHPHGVDLSFGALSLTFFTAGALPKPLLAAIHVVVTTDAAWLKECERESDRLLHGAINASAVLKLQAVQTAAATRSILIVLLICKQDQHVAGGSQCQLPVSAGVEAESTRRELHHTMDGRDQEAKLHVNSQSFVAAAAVALVLIGGHCASSLPISRSLLQALGRVTYKPRYIFDLHGGTTASDTCVYSGSLQ